MGLFSWLFKRKKEEQKKDEHRITDVKQNETQNSATNIAAENDTIKPSSAASKPVRKPKDDVADDIAANEIINDKSTDTVKVKGFGGAFDIKRARDGRYVFNLYAANRVIVATSQIYSSSQSALIGIKSVVANAERANIEDQTLAQYDTQPYPKWEIYVDKGGQYRWRLLATNGNCILHSQGYTQKSTCKKGIESVIRTAKSAQIDKSYLEK